MPETTPLIKAALNLRVGAGFDVYDNSMVRAFSIAFKHSCGAHTVRWTVALRRPKRSVDHAVNI